MALLVWSDSTAGWRLSCVFCVRVSACACVRACVRSGVLVVAASYIMRTSPHMCVLA